MRYLKKYELERMAKADRKYKTVYLNKSDYNNILSLPSLKYREELIKKYKLRVSLSEKEYNTLIKKLNNPK